MFSLVIAAILAAAAPDAPVSTPAPTSAPDPDQKIKCKAAEETGSLASRRKVCMTVGQWKQLARDSQNAGERMADTTICPSCQGH